MEHLRIPSTIMKKIDSNAENQNLPLLPLLRFILDDFSPDFMTFPSQSNPRGRFRRVPESLRGALCQSLTSVDTFRCVYPIFANICLKTYPKDLSSFHFSPNKSFQPKFSAFVYKISLNVI